MTSPNPSGAAGSRPTTWPSIASRSRRARRAGAVLRWAIGAHDRVPGSRPPSAAALTDLGERAEYHGISPLVHLCADRLDDLDAGVRRTLESSYHHAVRRHLFMLDDLAGLHTVLEVLGCPWMVVKGPVLAEAVYSRSDLRAYTDLDVVVPRPAVEHAVAILVEHGASPLDPGWRGLLARGRGEIELRLASGAIVDLHWALINMPQVRGRFSIDLPTLFARARTIDIEGRRYRTLGRADTVVHLALHAVLSGGDRLVWVKDLEMATADDDLDWGEVADTARSWGALPALAAQLSRGQRLTGRDLPPDARLALAPGRAWSLACAAADRLTPPEASRGAMSLAKRVSRATAPTPVGGLVELGRALRRGARRAAPRPPEDRRS